MVYTTIQTNNFIAFSESFTTPVAFRYYIFTIRTHSYHYITISLFRQNINSFPHGAVARRPVDCSLATAPLWNIIFSSLFYLIYLSATPQLIPELRVLESINQFYSFLSYRGSLANINHDTCASPSALDINRSHRHFY